MSRIITIPNVCTMILGRIVNYNTKTYAGIENVPHLCIKTKYGIKIDGLPETEGYAWFGINIINKGKYLLTESDRLPVIKQLEDALSQMVDLLEYHQYRPQTTRYYGSDHEYNLIQLEPGYCESFPEQTCDHVAQWHFSEANIYQFED